MENERNNISYITEQAITFKQLVHASNLITKWNKPNLSKNQKEALPDICAKYKEYLSSNINLKGYTEETIRERVKLLNTYYNFLHSRDFDNLFSAQESCDQQFLRSLSFYYSKII